MSEMSLSAARKTARDIKNVFKAAEKLEEAADTIMELHAKAPSLEKQVETLVGRREELQAQTEASEANHSSRLETIRRKESEESERSRKRLRALKQEIREEEIAHKLRLEKKEQEMGVKLDALRAVIKEKEGEVNKLNKAISTAKRQLDELRGALSGVGT